jgi:hypothetical protein
MGIPGNARKNKENPGTGVGWGDLIIFPGHSPPEILGSAFYFLGLQNAISCILDTFYVTPQILVYLMSYSKTLRRYASQFLLIFGRVTKFGSEEKWVAGPDPLPPHQFPP